MAQGEIQAQGAPTQNDVARREQSTIAFPYHDFEASAELAQAVYNRSGLGTCDLDELAAEMKQVLSGSFRVKIAAAKLFDLIDKDGRSSVKLTELGRRIITQETPRAAKAESFLKVPLYAAIFEQYKGQKLPPMKALEREMQAHGVSPKVADRARQTFERSARQAGFFEAGDDRLVRPKVESEDLPTPDRDDAERGKPERPKPSGGGRVELPTGKDHPLIQGLLITLPEPGSPWDGQGRQAWLKMAGSIFDMIYKMPSNSAPAAAGAVEKDDDL